MFKKTLTMDPGYVEAYFNLGMYISQGGDGVIMMSSSKP